MMDLTQSLPLGGGSKFSAISLRLHASAQSIPVSETMSRSICSVRPSTSLCHSSFNSSEACLNCLFSASLGFVIASNCRLSRCFRASISAAMYSISCFRGVYSSLCSSVITGDKARLAPVRQDIFRPGRLRPARRRYPQAASRRAAPGQAVTGPPAELPGRKRASWSHRCARNEVGGKSDHPPWGVPTAVGSPGLLTDLCCAIRIHMCRRPIRGLDAPLTRG